jgi:hypothetical protein
MGRAGRRPAPRRPGTVQPHLPGSRDRVGPRLPTGALTARPPTWSQPSTAAKGVPRTPGLGPGSWRATRRACGRKPGSAPRKSCAAIRDGSPRTARSTSEGPAPPASRVHRATGVPAHPIEARACLHSLQRILVCAAGPQSVAHHCVRLRQGGYALRLARGDRRCLGPLEGGGKQVAGRQAAVGPPFLGDGEDLLLGGEVVELIGDLDGLTEREVAR